MALYTKESVEAVKEAADMVEVASARTDLRRVGGRYTGLCPFHDERTPSFSVNPDAKLYHCFGCGESGDVIGFVETTEAVDFRGAVEALAERYGVELRREEEDPEAEQRRRRRERLLALLERAAAYYARLLWEAPEAQAARAHLLGRGLSEAVLRDFRVGFAPDGWERLTAAALRSGYGHEEMAAAGLGQRGRRGGFHDRFRSRIMFPLADARGRVLGFGARATEDGQQPKYLNSSESDLYRKGRQLFGIDRARAAAARAGRIVVVEGYTDVLALHQAGVVETVAVMGTATTREQLAELARAAGTVFLALDADRSGQEAMLRAAQLAPGRGVELRVVGMPEGSDPAELVAAEGADAFRARLEHAVSVPEFQAHRVLASAEVNTAGGRDRALAQLRPLVALTPKDSATRHELVRRLTSRLDVLPEHLLSAPGAGQAAAAAAEPSRPAGPGAALDPTARPESAFLALCLAQGELGRDYLRRAGEEQLVSPALRAVRDHLLEHFDEPSAGLEDDPRLAAVVDEIVMLADRQPASDQHLRLSFLQLELRRIERELRRADEDGDLERQRALWPPREDARAQIDELMGAAG